MPIDVFNCVSTEDLTTTADTLALLRQDSSINGVEYEALRRVEGTVASFLVRKLRQEVEVEG